VRLSELAAVQRQREIPTRFIQAAGAIAQKTFLRRLLDPRATPRLPPILLLARIPVLRSIFARLMAFGLWKVRVNSP
jgi:hypothetical protein